MKQAFKLNLSIDQGGTFSKTCTWKTGTPAAAVDLTGCTARMHIRLKIAAADPALLALTTENGGIVLGGVAGTVQIKLTATQTTAITTWTRAVYDLEIVLADTTTVRRLLYGSITVSPEVTR